MDDLFEIKNEKDIVYFLDQCEYFHDSCIFEMHYKSGAYVSENLTMHPVNSVNTLTIQFHSQNETCRRFDVVFTDLIHFHFTPLPCRYSCEIFKGKLMQRNGVFYWSPDDEFDPEDVSCLTDNNATWVCCRKIKWRIYDAESGHNN